ncbi:BTB/POZ domain-containing protein [Aphelenchoides avenae]|nr:BTB/POZ domain-containing protein [Aphelenchus avenae]
MATPGRQRGQLTLTIDNARNYFKSDPGRGNRRTSQPLMLCGLRWHLEAYRRTVNGVPHIGAYVYCSRDGGQSWRKCKATCVFRVVNTLVDDVVRRLSEEFVNADDNWGFDGLLRVEDMLKTANGYIKNNRVTVECSVTAFMSSVSAVAEGASGTKRRCTDVKLVVEGRELYANKGVLAASCDYFEALFYVEFDDRRKDEIALDDVKHEDLVAFMKVINPPCSPIDANNLVAVLRLADRFDAKLYLEKCEQFLVEKIRLKDAIVALDSCNLLSDLKAQFLDKIGKEDLKALCEDETYEQLSPETALYA